MTDQPRAVTPIIEISGDLPEDGHAAYHAIIGAGAAGLANDEWWVIAHEKDGPLWATASKRLDEPVIAFCEALKCDWDEATESGFHLARLKKVVMP